jgi:hypothetical protein
MGILTDVKRVVEEQRLGFFATVCPDGSPNVSPKGTTASGTRAKTRWSSSHTALLWASVVGLSPG